MKVYLAILGVLKIRNLGCNYAAVWKFEKYGHLKKNETWNGNVFQKYEVESLRIVYPRKDDSESIFGYIVCFLNK